MKTKYEVRLSEKERERLKGYIKRGKGSAYTIRHANILLKVDLEGAGWSDERIAESFSVSEHTVANIRKWYVEGGLERAISRKKQDRPSRKRILDGAAEARLIALGCSSTPEGHARWSLRLLAEKAVELEIADEISYETVRRVLKKTRCARS